jgi:NDP-sugar pyrophosphorylase family protein
MIQVVIPMTGYGSRFVKAGYTHLKPFIKVFEKTMIEWIVSMYDQDSTKFVFICRSAHLADNEDFKILNSIAKHAKIVSIGWWKKLGPVNDFCRAYNEGTIDKSLPTIINYCDFFCLWDSKSFIKECLERDVDGAIPCYTGFHPHLIPKKNLYASCKVDKDQYLEEIREKFSFKEDKTLANHSPGIYYFKSGEVAYHYSNELIKADDSLNGEFYASLVYNYLVKDNKRVWCPDNIRFFCQWGTPEDLEEFNMWMNILKGANQ